MDPMDHGSMDHGEHVAMFRERFWISLALTVPVLLFSEMIQDWLGFTMPSFPGDDLVAPIFGTAVFLYGGLVFLQGGLQEHGAAAGHDALDRARVDVAFAASGASAFGWLDSSSGGARAARRRDAPRPLDGDAGTRSGLRGLEALAAPSPTPRNGSPRRGSTRCCSTRSVRATSSWSVPAVPSRRTARSSTAKPRSTSRHHRRVAPGRANHWAIGSWPARSPPIPRSVSGRGRGRRHHASLHPAAGCRRAGVALARAGAGDRAAALLFYVAVAAGAATLLWLALGEPDEALERTITVLAIACPHALGLAIPLATRSRRRSRRARGSSSRIVWRSNGCGRSMRCCWTRRARCRRGHRR